MVFLNVIVGLSMRNKREESFIKKKNPKEMSPLNFVRHEQCEFYIGNFPMITGCMYKGAISCQILQ
uniref:Uncharacterized protein n=1 Tax=Nelumbo nucifera TaxID=4432 RepID=A0A822YBQ6_NELNU|nr:TPA_asm: hypothetical protein HUJ06_030419 [Nelumbo nucifera]